MEEGCIVQTNIIWGSRSGRSLFGKDGISGSVNVELSPQIMSRIGAAFGAFLNPGKRAAVCCDNLPGNAMLKHGMISGLLSAGIEVFDLGQLTTPVLRYAVKQLALDAGIHIFASKNKEGMPGFICGFCWQHSVPAEERKIENIYIRDDFKAEPSGH